MFLKISIFSLFFIILASLSPFNIHPPHTDPETPHPLYSYRVISSNITDKTLQLSLGIIPESHDNNIETIDTSYNPYYQNTRNTISKKLLFELSVKSPNYLSFSLRDSEDERYEIPHTDPFPSDFNNNLEDFDVNTLKYTLNIKSEPFSLEVLRKDTNETLINTENFDLIFSRKYLELSTLLPTHEIFGFGERNHEFKLRVPGVYTLWNRDLFAEMDDALGGKSTYGSHPMYLMRENSNNFHIVSLRNSFAMDVDLTNVETITGQGVVEQAKLTYKITGGVLDFRVFLGSNAEETVKMYHKYVGGHLLPPFWAMGFHLSRYGYKSWGMVRELLDDFEEHKMPLDVIWFDIDYMRSYRAFTVDQANFPSVSINSDLENVYKKKLVVILDPGMASEPKDQIIEEGLTNDIFLKTPEGAPLVGCVWPGRVFYPDFMNPKTQSFWDKLVAELYDTLKFSGLWIDMNEFANLIDGAVNSLNPGQECDLNRHDNHYSIDEKCNYKDEDYRVFKPGDIRQEVNGLCLNAKHVNDLTEFEVHNFNGLFNAKTTYNTLKDKLGFQQPFILTRSTAPGSGKFAIHWTGDNRSGWDWMKISIAGILNFGLFGIPFTGADVCGFAGDAWEELCVRWMQLGSVYPFFRNHNFMGSKDQDPFAFGDTMLKGSLESIRFRTKGVGTVVRPLFFHYPGETICYQDEVLDQEFLLGESLLVTPILHAHEHQIHPYFPGLDEVWFDFHSGEKHLGGSHHLVSNGLTDPISMFIRAGSIVYRQEINDTVRSSADLDNRFFLSIALQRDPNSNNSFLESQGQMMSIYDYNNYSTLEKCIETDCMLSIRASYKEFSENQRKQLLLVFEAPDNEKNVKLDKLGIIGVDIYGILEGNDEDIRKEAVGLRICGHKGQDLAMEEIAVKVRREQDILRLRFGKYMNMEASDQILIELKI